MDGAIACKCHLQQYRYVDFDIQAANEASNAIGHLQQTWACHTIVISMTNRIRNRRIHLRMLVIAMQSPVGTGIRKMRVCVPRGSAKGVVTIKHNFVQHLFHVEASHTEDHNSDCTSQADHAYATGLRFQH